MGTCREIVAPDTLGPQYWMIASMPHSEGDPKVIDTCDLTLAYGGTAWFNDDTLVSFFHDKRGKLLPAEALRNRLKFLAEFPNIEGLKPYLAEALEGIGDPNTLRNSINRGFGRMFDRFGNLYRKYKIPMDNRPLAILTTTAWAFLHAGTGTEELGMNITTWACRASQFPVALLPALGEVLVKAGLDMHALRGTRGIDPKTGAVDPASPFGRCIHDPAISPARRKILEAAKHRALKAQSI